MKSKKSKKLTTETVKLIAGVILGTVAITGSVIFLLSIVDLSLTRKILIGLIALLILLLIEFFARKVAKGKDRRKTSWSLLLDLTVSVLTEVNPESKRFFQKELFIRMSRSAFISWAPTAHG